jgi:hypothetical protein
MRRGHLARVCHRSSASMACRTRRRRSAAGWRESAACHRRNSRSSAGRRAPMINVIPSPKRATTPIKIGTAESTPSQFHILVLSPMLMGATCRSHWPHLSAEVTIKQCEVSLTSMYLRRLLVTMHLDTPRCFDRTTPGSLCRRFVLPTRQKDQCLATSALRPIKRAEPCCPARLRRDP